MTPRSGAANGKNKLTVDHAVLYNLVAIRKGVYFFVILTAIWLTVSVIVAGALFINVLKNSPN